MARAVTRSAKSAATAARITNARSLRVEGARRCQIAEETYGHGPHDAPGADRRRFIHRQVAHRPMVGIVETRELRDQHPDRQEGYEPDRALGGQYDRQPETDRAAVREGEQATTADVAPPAWLPRHPACGAGQSPSNVVHIDEPGPAVSGTCVGGGEVTCRLLLAHPALWESWIKGNGLSCSARTIALTSATLSPRCDSRLALISARRQSSESRCSA